MAMLPEPFNPADHVGEFSGDVVPDGWYDFVIQKADSKETKSGGGSLVVVWFKITGPTHAGRMVFNNFNISNPNATAERIGREQFGALSRAVGLNEPFRDTDILVGRTLRGRVKTEDGRDGPKNIIAAFKPLDDFSGAKEPTDRDRFNGPLSASKMAPPWLKR